MEKLILIEENNKIKVNSLEELVQKLLSNNYYELNSKEKLKILETKTYQNCILKNIPIIKIEKHNLNINLNQNVFILYDEITYILSLVKNNIMILLEKTDSNIFTKCLDKSNIKDNYIIVNRFIDDILNNYLSNINFIKIFSN